MTVVMVMAMVTKATETTCDYEVDVGSFPTARDMVCLEQKFFAARQHIEEEIERQRLEDEWWDRRLAEMRQDGEEWKERARQERVNITVFFVKLILLAGFLYTLSSCSCVSREFRVVNAVLGSIFFVFGIWGAVGIWLDN